MSDGLKDALIGSPRVGRDVMPDGSLPAGQHRFHQGGLSLTPIGYDLYKLGLIKINWDTKSLIGNLKFELDDPDPWDKETVKIHSSPYWGPVTVCECGAAKTPNPNCHSRWCPLFQELMK